MKKTDPTPQLIEITINDLKTLKFSLAGDDSGLDNIWDDIAVQMKTEYSFYWDLYINTVKQLILQNFTLLKIIISDIDESLFCEKIIDWDSDDYTDYYIDYVLREILSRAEMYTNKRIQKYVDSDF